MRKIILITVILLLSITTLASINNHKIEAEDKSELVRLVLEERMRSDPVEGSLLVVNSPQLDGVNLPQFIGNVPVMLITMDQLKAWGTNPVSIHALLFTNVSANALTGNVNISTYYNSYFPGYWNAGGSYYFVNLFGAWVISSKEMVQLV